MKRPHLCMWLFGCALCTANAWWFGFAAPEITYVAWMNQPAYTLVSTHFSHLNVHHLLTNMLALGLLLYLFPLSVRLFCSAGVLCIGMVSGYVVLYQVPSVLGFSALLYCLPGAYWAVTLKQQDWTKSITLVVILCLYLFIINPMDHKNHTWTPMVAAHLLGFVAGALVQLIEFQIIKTNKLSNQKHPSVVKSI